MPKEIFKASRIVIKDLPKDQKISANKLKEIKGGKLFRPELLSREWLNLAQRDSETYITVPLNAQRPQRCYQS